MLTFRGSQSDELTVSRDSRREYLLVSVHVFVLEVMTIWPVRISVFTDSRIRSLSVQSTSFERTSSIPDNQMSSSSHSVHTQHAMATCDGAKPYKPLPWRGNNLSEGSSTLIRHNRS